MRPAVRRGETLAANYRDDQGQQRAREKWSRPPTDDELDRLRAFGFQGEMPRDMARYQQIMRSLTQTDSGSHWARRYR